MLIYMDIWHSGSKHMKLLGQHVAQVAGVFHLRKRQQFELPHLQAIFFKIQRHDSWVKTTSSQNK